MTTFGDGAFGLLIGVDEFRAPQYADQPLPQAANDANDLAFALTNSLGWHSDHLEVLAGIVNKSQVVQGFGRICDKIVSAGAAELFLLYISTHGHPYKSVRRPYEVTLLTTDGVLAPPLQMFESTLTRALLGFCIDSVPARQKVVIVDACYAAGVAMAEDLVPFDSRELDVAVLASSVRRSYARHSRRNSEFTHALLEGIENLTGRNVGLTDLFSAASHNPDIAPYLDNKGRYIALGASIPTAPRPQLDAASFEAFFAAMLNTVAARVRHNPLTDPYVARIEAERRFDQLTSHQQGLVTIVGPPGGGKTTFLLRSASRAVAAGSGVLWIGPTNVKAGTAAEILDGVLSPLGAGLTLAAAIAVAKRRRPWLIVLDGINEWAVDTAETKRLLGGFAAAAKAAGALLVLSCREESWRTLGQALGDDERADSAGIVLSNFDDAEVRQIVESVGRGLPSAAISVLKRPLFVRMLLDVRATGDRPFDLGELFDAYVKAKASGIGARLGRAVANVIGELRACARWLLEHRAETMPVEHFFGTMSESMSVALLEEGLCVRTRGEVGFESETLLEYLISLDLPDDPFDGVDFRQWQPGDAWWGAAAFKAVRLEPARLQEALEALAGDWWSQEYVLSLIARSPDPIRHLSVVESLAGEDLVLIDTLKRFLDEMLDRRDTRQTVLVLRAVRAHIIGAYGSWREKDWADTAPAQFDARLAKDTSSQIGLSVLRAHLADPATTFDTLLGWLHDETYLGDKEARVSDFASLLLRHIGWRDLDGIALAIERYAEGTLGLRFEGFGEIARVLAFVVRNRHDIPLSVVARWIASGGEFLRRAATVLVPAVPDADTPALMTVLQEYARREDISETERKSAIASIGTRNSRAALNCLAALSAFEECQSGVVSAYANLADDFPAEVSKRIAAFNETTLLRPDTIAALHSFYLAHLRIAPDAAVAFFRRLRGQHPGRYARDIAYTIHALTESFAVVTAFVEEQLPIEQSGNALELYHYYLRKIRSSTDGDVPWIGRWIESGDGTYGLVSYLLNGEMSYDNKAELYLKLDEAGPRYENDFYGLNERGTAFVRRFSGDPRSDNLTEDGKVWISEIVSGHSSGEAARIVAKARIDRLIRKSKNQRGKS